MDIWIPDLLQLLRIIFRRLFTVVFGLGPCADHLARSEDQCRSLWLSYSHDCCGESLGFILNVLAAQTDVP